MQQAYTIEDEDHITVGYVMTSGLDGGIQLFVHVTHRGQGYARMLLALLIEAADKEQATLRLHVAPSIEINPDKEDECRERLRKLYQEFGFETDTTLPSEILARLKEEGSDRYVMIRFPR